MWESFVRFSKNPIFHTIVSFILGLIVSFVFYKLSIAAPELTYYIHPIRTSVVKVGESSAIKVFSRKSEVRGDISAVQIAFWNNGKKPVVSADVLSPFQIRVGEGIEIIEAKIRKTSRELIALQLDKATENVGVIGLSWRILEQGDGGIIQIIYRGGTDVPIKLAGTIIGQRVPTALAFKGSLQSLEEQYESIARQNRVYGVSFIVTFIAALAYFIFSFYYKEEVPSSSILFNFLVTLLLIEVLFIFLSQPSAPPFGF